MTATFENVPGLILKDYKRYLQSMVTSLLRMSYQVRVAVLTASFYGDAQNRRRLILWAARKDCVLPSLPIETHGPDGRHPLNTCKDALQALEEHNPMSSRSSGVVSIKSNNNNNGGGGGATTIYNHICPKLKKGNNDGNADKNSSTHHNHHQQQQQQQHDNFVLHENEPSRTILARARPHIHYKFDRFITVREAACLQSFPPTFQFFGSISNQYSQVGNAVPVKLATAVARSVAEVHGLP
jgi:DNA (cytosine-5)-methyltransferase 1